MFVDGREVPSGTKIDADACVVGAGPAGIAVATALAEQGVHVVLAESGGFEVEPETQSLNDGECVGLNYRMSASRPRCLGGAGTHWAGNARPLDVRNFATRSWVPHSGWPFSRSEIEPWLGKARIFCGLPEAEPDATHYRAAGGTPMPWSEPLETAIWQISPITHFGEKFRPLLAAASGLSVLLNANLIELADDPNTGLIVSAGFATLAGSRFTIVARRYVLACGGIENARLLLAMTSERHPSGLGNRHGQVGRFFMEHPELSIGLLVTNRSQSSSYRHQVSLQSSSSLAEGFRLSDAAQQKSRIGDAAFWPIYSVRLDGPTLPDADLKFGPEIQDLSSRLSSSKLSGQRWSTLLTISFEQSPDPASRVTLAESRDALGMRRTRLDWRLNDFDRRTFATAIKMLAREAGRQNIGRVWLRLPFRDIDLDHPEAIRFDIPLTRKSIRPNQLDTELCWGCHHMGTTRMSDDPRAGTVDSNCRLHEVGNLFVAGSSVFPNAGLSNPTLTILAMALRLANHIKSL